MPRQCASEHSMLAYSSKSAAQNHFQDKGIGAVRQARSHPEIDLPVGAGIQINDREKLLLLLSDRIESCQGAVGCIVLEAGSDRSRKVVADFAAGAELEAAALILPLSDRTNSGLAARYQGPHRLSMIGMISKVHVSVEKSRRW